VFVGTPIDDAMWHVAPDVVTLCVGQASATAAILCTADAAGKRAILPHGRGLLVQPHVASSHGSISDLAVEATEVARMRTQTEAILARHTNKRAEDIRADTDHALVLAGQAAVDYGLVDGLFVADRPGTGVRLHQMTISRDGDDTGPSPKLYVACRLMRLAANQPELFAGWLTRIEQTSGVSACHAVGRFGGFR
jgi:hypothetical protein